MSFIKLYNSFTNSKQKKKKKNRFTNFIVDYNITMVNSRKL